MKTIRELYKDTKIEAKIDELEANVQSKVNDYSQKARVQGRWARLKFRKQAEKAQELLEVPQTQIKRLTTDLQHDVQALKRFYHSQKKEITKLGKTFKRNKDRLVEKSKVISSFAKGESAETRKVKVVTDTEIA